MKKLILLSVLSGWTIITCAAQSTSTPDSLGLPGDNLNLYAVMDLFQKSETFEIFEQKLNEENSKINNLDLNNDDKIDYIKVIDNKDGDNHAIVLQVPINEKENQDVAVIELEKDKAGDYQLQIIGNEEIYGKDYIIEPAPEKTTVAEQKSVKPATSTTTNVTIINNYTYVDPNPYPIITYVYRPAYVVYVSPWYYGYYPVAWHPWRPWYYRSYYNHHHHHYAAYHSYYHRTAVCRSPVVHSYYGPRRNNSAVVRQNNSQGTYRKNYQSNSSGRGRSNPGYRSNSGGRSSNNPSFNGGGNNGNRSRGNGQQNNNQSGRGTSNNPSMNGGGTNGRTRSRGDVQQNNSQPSNQGNNNPSRSRTRTENSGGSRQNTQQGNRQNTNMQRQGGGGARQQGGNGGGGSRQQGGGNGGGQGGSRGRSR